MRKQPGVMLYFDIRPCLERLSLEDQGQLFRAILDYGEYGAEPDFEYMLGIAWDFIRPRLDRDRERYEEISRKRSEAARIRWEEASANASDAMQAMPTTTPTSTPKTNATSSSKSVTTPPDFPGKSPDFADISYNFAEV